MSPSPPEPPPPSATYLPSSFTIAELESELTLLRVEFYLLYDIPPPCLPDWRLGEFYMLRQYKLAVYSEKCEIMMNMLDNNPPPSYPDITLLPNTLPHEYTESELMIEIIKLEDEFYTLYQFPPDDSTIDQIHHFYTLRNTKHCVLRGKYELLQDMTALDVHNPVDTSSPYA